MPPTYSLDNTINEFFQTQTTVTRKQCDEKAISLAGSPIRPSPIQGAFSYTLIAGASQSKIVQFRAQTSLLDMDILDLAQNIHPSFVASISYHGILGESQPLSVYVTEKLFGSTYIETRFYDESTAEAQAEAASRRLTTVVDFARFFAQAWKGRQSLPLDQTNALRLQHEQDLDLLRQSLPRRFSGVLKILGRDLSLVYRSGFPLVLTHDDLCEMNIFIDPQTGHITGFIDWADAKILPFGLALCGVLNMLGWMDSKGWHYYANHRDLEANFWTTFQEEIGAVLFEEDKHAILTAATIGLFQRYGFAWDGGVKRRPITDSHSSVRYLDAFLGPGMCDGSSFFLLEN